MKTILALATAVAILALQGAALAADQADGVELWKGARLGMTPAQVQALFPSAITPTKPDHMRGAPELLAIEGVEFAAQKASAEFYFRDEHLEVVLLRFNVAPGDQSNLQKEKQIHDLLTQQYGAAYKCDNTDNLTAKIHTCDWYSNDVRIGFIYLEIPGNAVLNVAYRKGQPQPQANP
jgi:hypothetical protein